MTELREPEAPASAGMVATGWPAIRRFGVAWVGGGVACLPMVALALLEGRFDTYFFRGFQWPFALGLALSVLSLHLRAGTRPSDAARRTSVTLFVFGVMFVLVLIADDLSRDSGWAGPAMTLVAVSPAVAVSLAVSWNSRSRGWRVITIPMALVAIPVAAIWFRPIANVIAAKVLGAIEPLPHPEFISHGYHWLLLTPTYAEVCQIVVLLLPGLLVLLSQTSNNRQERFRRGILVSLGVCAAWALQGFETTRLGSDSPTHVRVQRSMGRPTVVHYFEKDRERSRDVYGWRRPFGYGDYISICATPPYESSIDWNDDGRWDVWTRRVKVEAPPGCGIEYRVDTKGILGEPDWTFVLPMDDQGQAEDMIAKARLPHLKEPSGEGADKPVIGR